ncbi:MAG: hypothetical protein WCK02_10075 [Bacteroidota bacterium]
MKINLTTKNIKKTLFLSILLLSLYACKKKVDNERPEFCGSWTGYSDCGSKASLEIAFSNSDTEYDVFIFGTGGTISYEGHARANDKKLKISQFNTFDIIEYPHKVDTNIVKLNHYEGDIRPNWQMKLSGLKPALFHVTETFTFYKNDYKYFF